MSSELIISLILLHDSTNILEKKKTKDEFLNLNINLVKKKKILMVGEEIRTQVSRTTNIKHYQLS